MENVLQLNAEIYRGLGVIAEDETLLRRAARYIKKLAAKKQDETLMTEEELLEKIRRGEEQYRRGECYEMLPGETFTEFIHRVG